MKFKKKRPGSPKQPTKKSTTQHPLLAAGGKIITEIIIAAIEHWLFPH